MGKLERKNECAVDDLSSLLLPPRESMIVSCVLFTSMCITAPHCGKEQEARGNEGRSNLLDNLTNGVSPIPTTLVKIVIYSVVNRLLPCYCLFLQKRSSYLIHIEVRLYVYNRTFLTPSYTCLFLRSFPKLNRNSVRSVFQFTRDCPRERTTKVSKRNIF